MKLPLLTAKRCVLLIGDDSVSIYDVGSSTRLVVTLPWDANDFEGRVLRAITKDCNSHSVLILYDMLEQHYRKERIPKVGPMDKAGVIKRKLQVAFPKYNIRAALKLKEKGGGKHDGRSGGLYLFAGVPGSSQLKRIFGSVRASLAPISGLCLLPLESSGLVKSLVEKVGEKHVGGGEQWAVFIGQHQSGSLRQIVIRNGEMALTRMTPSIATDATTETLVGGIVQEFSATMSYISRFGYSQEDSLDVILVADPEVGDRVGEAIGVPCHYTSLTADEAAKILRLGRLVHQDGQYADGLHAAWAGQKSGLMLPMRSQDLQQIHAPRKAAVLFMVLLFLSSVYLFWQAFMVSGKLVETYDKIDHESATLNKVESLYEAEVDKKRSMGLDVELVQGTLEAYKQLEDHDINALAVFKRVAETLENDRKINEIIIERVEKKEEGDKRRSMLPGVNKDDDDRAYEATFAVELPASLGAARAVEIFDDLRSRLQKNMPDHVIEVGKAPAPNSYDVVVEGSSGRAEKEDPEDFLAEMKIWKPVK